MTLDPELVRKILIYLEDHLVLYKDEDDTRRFTYIGVGTKQLAEAPEFADFGDYDIIYTVLQLQRGGMICLECTPAPGEEFYHLKAIDITWQGHEFLANIKSDTIWKSVSSVSKKIGGISVSGLGFLAKTIVTTLINNPEKIQQILNSF